MQQTKEQKAEALKKFKAITGAAEALANAAIENGVAVTDVIDLVRALACKEVRKLANQKIEIKFDQNNF